MKKLLTILSFLLVWSAPLKAQLFEVYQDLPVTRADGSPMALPFGGGLNQPQFSNIDLNGDGRLDFFVFDRSGETRLAFLADTLGGYFYDPEYAEFFPRLQEFMLLHDYNNDGKPDLWAYNLYDGKVQVFKNLGGANPSFEYVQNMRAYNYDNPPFDTSDFVHFKGTFPDVVDLDQDGDMDYVSNIAYCGSNITFYRNTAIDNSSSLENLDFDIATYCLGGLGENGIQVILNAKCYFKRKKKHCATKTLGFFDNDGDGDMDLFFGSSEQPTIPIYFIENGKQDLSMSKDTFISIDTNYFSQAVQDQLPISPTTSFVDVDHDGIRDLILSSNEILTVDYAVRETENVSYFKNYGTNSIPDYQFQQNDFLNGEMLDFGAFTAPALGDLDGDGDQDMIIATNGSDHLTNNKTHYLVYLKNTGTPINPSFQVVSEDTIITKLDSFDAFIPCLADIDADHDLDLFLGMLDGTIRYYRNDGNAQSAHFVLQEAQYKGIDVGERAAPFFYDLSGDGVLDLLVGEYDGNINYFVNTGDTSNASFLLTRDSLGGILLNEMIHQTIIDPDRGVIDTILPHYYGSSTLGVGHTNDGFLALFAGGAEGILRVYLVPGDLDSPFIEHNFQTFNSKTQSASAPDWGSDLVVAVGLMDDDIYEDLILGNSRGGIHYMRSRNNVSTPSLNQRQDYGLYPNPSKGQLVLRLQGNYVGLHYSILDISGRTVEGGRVRSDQRITLSTAVSNGMYFLHLESKHHEFTAKKFVLNR